MNHSIEKITTPSGELRHELRIWGRPQGAIRRRFKTKEEVQTYLSQFYASQEKIEKITLGDPLFETEFNYWLESRAKGFAPGWRRNIEQYWRDLAPSFEGKLVSDLNKVFFKEVEQSFEQKGLSRKTINQKLGLVLSVLNHSASLDRIDKHKLEGYKLTRAKRKTIEFWDKETSAKFLSYAREKYRGSNRWPYVVYLLALNTGMRAGEIWGLTWADLNPRAKHIDVERQTDLVTREFRETKGKESRRVPLSDALWLELEALKQERSSSDLVFHVEGRCIRHRKFAKRFERDVEKSGCQSISFHGMRHTFATLALDSGIPLKTVSVILGHKDLVTTNGYTHALKDGVKNVANSFNVT